MPANLPPSGCCLGVICSLRMMLPLRCSTCAAIGGLLPLLLQHRHPAPRSAMACSSNCGLRASSTASLRGWPVAEGKRERQTLLTIPMTRGELRVVKVNATARGYSMAGWVRELLRAEMVDLLP
jgi:hypothetical protein